MLRVAFVLRSTEVHPAFCDLSPQRVYACMLILLPCRRSLEALEAASRPLRIPFDVLCDSAALKAFNLSAPLLQPPKYEGFWQAVPARRHTNTPSYIGGCKSGAEKYEAGTFQKPETRNQKPDTRNQKSDTRNQKPETRKASKKQAVQPKQRRGRRPIICENRCRIHATGP